MQNALSPNAREKIYFAYKIEWPTKGIYPYPLDQIVDKRSNKH
jgi:hypothetical protein